MSIRQAKMKLFIGILDWPLMWTQYYTGRKYLNWSDKTIFWNYRTLEVEVTLETILSIYLFIYFNFKDDQWYA